MTAIEVAEKLVEIIKKNDWKDCDVIVDCFAHRIIGEKSAQDVYAKIKNDKKVIKISA